MDHVQSGKVEPIRAFFVNAAGEGVGALSPTVTIQRLDGQYWNGAAYQAGVSNLAMTAFPGITGAYVYNFDTAAPVLEEQHTIQANANDASVFNSPTPPAGLEVGGFLDDLDAAVSSRATQAQILSDATPFAGGNIDAAISSRAVAADVAAQLTAQGYTAARAILLDNLDALISSRSTLDGTGVQSAMTAQGYTAARALLLDFLDAAITSRAAPGDAMTLAANAVDAGALDPSAGAEIASAVLGATLADPGTVNTLEYFIQRMRKVLLNGVNITDGNDPETITVLEDDDSTTAFTQTEAADGLSRTRATP